jgi:hypothetical protein
MECWNDGVLDEIEELWDLGIFLFAIPEFLNSSFQYSSTPVLQYSKEPVSVRSVRGSTLFSDLHNIL